MHQRFFLKAILVCSLMRSATAQPLSHYEVTQVIAPFAGTVQTLAFGVNDLGAIVGTYNNGKNSHGFLSTNGKYTSFDVPGAAFTEGYAINNWGEIVGRWTDSAGLVTHGFILSNGRYRTLDVPRPGVVFTFPEGINALGDVVGWYMGADNIPHGFLWERGRFSAIDYPAVGVSETIASGINDLGQIVGIYNTSDGTHSFIEDRGRFRNIDGQPPSPTQFLANAINDRSQIVGGTTLEQHGQFDPFTLPFPGLFAVNATGINNFDQIVGVYGTRGATQTEGSFLLSPRR